MDQETFLRVVKAFADTPTDIDLSKGTLLLQVRDEIIEARASLKSGSLVVEEAGTTWPAATWVINRIARLPSLADRILQLVPAETHFVTPAASYLPDLEERPTEQPEEINDAAARLAAILDRRPAGTCSVTYLISDAGEGKTTLINELARRQAALYKDKKADWLLVPVALGGRTFLRFDDVVVGALMNRLRFPLLYFGAFTELVRLGVLVPALDGFEEMFVESSAGDAVSALGSLMNTFHSSGSLLISARSAYFEYKSLETQTRLFDALGGQSVSFGKMSLHRWDRAKFLQYAQLRGVDNGAEVFDTVAEQLGAQHPLLSRAVLVSRLLDVAESADDLSELLPRIETAPEDYFAQFVGAIVAREAKVKWIDRGGETAQPLLTQEEHEDLLSWVAQEMWTNQSQAVHADLLELSAELFCDSRGKPPHAKRQILERIKQHALIAESPEGRGKFSFDHEEFFHYFLGRSVARTLTTGRAPEIRHALSRGPLPTIALDATASLAARSEQVTRVIGLLGDVCQGEVVSSLARENAGALAVRMVQKGHCGGTLRHMVFPERSLDGRSFSGCRFENCYFYPTAVPARGLAEAVLSECTMERLEIAEASSLEGALFDKTMVSAVTPPGSEHAIFDPAEIRTVLAGAGARVADGAPPRDAPSPREPEQDLILAEKVCRKFLRATQINEYSLRQNLGSRWPHFSGSVLPRMLAAGIMKEVEYHGAGQQRRYQMGMPLRRVQEAVAAAHGSFAEFLRIAGSDGTAVVEKPTR